MAGATFAPRRQDSSKPAQRPARGPGVSDRSGKDHRNGGGGAADSRLRLLPFDAIKLTNNRRDLIKGIIPRVGITVPWGPPKCGKTFVVFDMAMHVALGREYRGRRVHQGPVVYCAFEGQTGIEARIEAYRQKFLAEEPETPPFYLMPVTLNLVRDQQELITLIKEQLQEDSPVLVVLDTLNRSLQGSESSDADMSNYVRAADAIREAFHCAIVIVHHCGHADNRPRGHSSLIGAVDAMIAVKRDPATEFIIATVELMKDGVAGDRLASKLERVDVGFDEDDEVISSCVVVPVEISKVPITAAPKPLPAAAKIALDALKVAIDEAGAVPPASNHIPPGTKTVSLGQWRRHAYQRDPDSGAEAKKKAFQRSRRTLQKHGIAGVWATENSAEEEAQCWLIA